MMTSYFEALLAEKFRKAVADPALAARLAGIAAGTIKAIDLVPRHSMDTFELDARIYDLRGKHLIQSELMERLGITKDRLYEGLRRGMARRRKALRVEDEIELGKVG